MCRAETIAVSTIPDSGIAAAALMVPSYFAADPEDDRGGFGAYTTADLKVPVLVTGADPQTDFLIDNPVSSYFEESSTPIAAFTLRGTSHFSMTHVRFGLPYMNAFFSLHLKNNNAETGGGRSPGYDVKAAETVYGDGPGSIIRNGSVRQSDSEINTRTRAAALPDGLLEVANLRERDTTLCVVEDVRGVGLRLLDTVRLDAGDADVIDVNTENGDVEDGRRKILLIDQDDYTTTFVRF